MGARGQAGVIRNCAGVETASTTVARGERPPQADHRTALSRKLRSGYALPAFPAHAAPSRSPTPSDHLNPTAAVAVFWSALWSGFSPPLTQTAMTRLFRRAPPTRLHRGDD